MGISGKQGILAVLSAILAVQGWLLTGEAAGRVTRKAPQAPPEVFTPLDYFRDGRSAVDSYLKGRQGGGAGDLADVVRRCQAACVRVDIRFRHVEGAYQSVFGSGVLVDGGRRLLTAGHSLDGREGDEVIVSLPGGQTRSARLMDREYDVYGGAGKDWAIMEILGPPIADAPEVTIGEIREGELAILLGYPEKIGINPRGELAYSSEQESFDPLVTLGTVRRTDPLVLSPRAGSIPLGGMSGGPVFDSRGRLVGIFVSVSLLHQGEDVEYTLNAAPLKALLPQVDPGSWARLDR